MRKALCFLLVVFAAFYFVSCGEDDDGRRLISFEYDKGQNSPDWVEKVYEAKVKGIVEKTGNAYTLTLEAYESSAATSAYIRFVATAGSDDDWSNHGFTVTWKPAGQEVMTHTGVLLSIENDDKESGFFRATFGNFAVSGGGNNAPMRNGEIQVHCYR
jgi:hypothetical protein